MDIDTKSPIPDVTVKVRGTKKLVVTNSDGEFIINNLCNEFNTLIISCIGYCNATCKNHHQHDELSHIYIIQDVSQLEVLTIQKLLYQNTFAN